jgi:6-phosphofructokinase 1
MNEDRFAIDPLGPASLDNPITLPEKYHRLFPEDRILLSPNLSAFDEAVATGVWPPSFEIAGPSRKIYFNPARVRAAIVTCGGLCPGLNAVIRALVMELWYHYGVRSVLGVRYGYQGLAAASADGFRELDPEAVGQIHEQGGTILGTSRGTPPTSEIVDTLHQNNINVLFTIGGDGTARGAVAIADEIRARDLQIAVVGIPKTIDNDIRYVRRSFGFETAVEVASSAIRSAHVEAVGALNGVGLVKLMGRHSGFIAAHATLSAGVVDYCLIPEVPFALEGESGFLALLERRLRAGKGHALLVVAEGAGQQYFQGQAQEVDASGNPKPGDIGVFLKERIAAHFKQVSLPVVIRYLDPSYLIRSAPANSSDSLFCAKLAQNAVHAAMAGKTAMLVGFWHGRVTHVPMRTVVEGRQTVDPQGELWFNVLESTGQPAEIGGQ